MVYHTDDNEIVLLRYLNEATPAEDEKYIEIPENFNDWGREKIQAVIHHLFERGEVTHPNIPGQRQGFGIPSRSLDMTPAPIKALITEKGRVRINPL